MQESGFVTVRDRDGVTGRIASIPRDAEGTEREVTVRLEDGRTVLVPIDVLVVQEDGSYYLPLRLADYESQYESGDTGRHHHEEQVVPVIEERVRVDRRQVETGKVRISKVVNEREEVVDEPMLQQQVEVTRVPVNRAVDGPVEVRYEGETMIIPLVEEVLVVEKRLMLKEELHITKYEAEVRQPQTITLRSEEAIVERVDSATGEVQRTEPTTERPGQGQFPNA
jgi:uncharacterized protein (TIGR02271 family)